MNKISTKEVQRRFLKFDPIDSASKTQPNQRSIAHEFEQCAKFTELFVSCCVISSGPPRKGGAQFGLPDSRSSPSLAECSTTVATETTQPKLP